MLEQEVAGFDEWADGGHGYHLIEKSRRSKARTIFAEASAACQIRGVAGRLHSQVHCRIGQELKNGSN
jgi:hypothetical protein